MFGVMFLGFRPYGAVEHWLALGILLAAAVCGLALVQTKARRLAAALLLALGLAAGTRVIEAAHYPDHCDVCWMWGVPWCCP